MADKGVQVVAVMVNMATMNEADAHALQARFAPTPPGENTPAPDEDAPPLVFVLPALAALGKPSIRDVARWLKAAVIHGNDHLGALVDNEVVAAMQVGNFLDYLQDGSLVITPGDRADILLASLAARLSSAYPDIAGVLLTAAFPCPRRVHRLIQGWPALPCPCWPCARPLCPQCRPWANCTVASNPTTNAKFTPPWGTSNATWTSKPWGVASWPRPPGQLPSCSNFRSWSRPADGGCALCCPKAAKIASCAPPTSCFSAAWPTSSCSATRTASACACADLGLDLEKARILQPELSPDFEDYAVTYHELRKHKGVSLDEARERMTDATYFGTMMVYKGQADGLVSGSVNTTAHTVRPPWNSSKPNPATPSCPACFSCASRTGC